MVVVSKLFLPLLCSKVVGEWSLGTNYVFCIYGGHGCSFVCILMSQLALRISAEIGTVIQAHPLSHVDLWRLKCSGKSNCQISEIRAFEIYRIRPASRRVGLYCFIGACK